MYGGEKRRGNTIYFRGKGVIWSRWADQSGDPFGRLLNECDRLNFYDARLWRVVVFHPVVRKTRLLASIFLCILGERVIRTWTYYYSVRDEPFLTHHQIWFNLRGATFPGVISSISVTAWDVVFSLLLFDRRTNLENKLFSERKKQFWVFVFIYFFFPSFFPSVSATFSSLNFDLSFPEFGWMSWHGNERKTLSTGPGRKTLSEPNNCFPNDIFPTVIEDWYMEGTGNKNQNPNCLLWGPFVSIWWWSLFLWPGIGGKICHWRPQNGSRFPKRKDF